MEKKTLRKKAKLVLNTENKAEKVQPAVGFVPDEPAKPENPTLYEQVENWCNETSTDIFIYSGAIGAFEDNGFISERFIAVLEEKVNRCENCMLFLTSYGGDADWAYRISATLKRLYKCYDVVVCGACKSAATLIALGARTLYFSDRGELGPLDVQTRKKDEWLSRRSPLDVFQSKDMISNWASDFCKKFFFEMLDSGAGVISMEVASMVSNKLSESLFSPLMAKINPLEVGEIYRAMNVANAYGQIIKSDNVKDSTLEKLVASYPSHSFVIDISQAQKLFKDAKPLEPIQKLLYNADVRFKRNVLHRPYPGTGLVEDVLSFLAEEEKRVC